MKTVYEKLLYAYTYMDVVFNQKLDALQDKYYELKARRNV